MGKGQVVGIPWSRGKRTTNKYSYEAGESRQKLAQFNGPKMIEISDAGEIILINGDVPRIVVRASEAVLIETERR
jgi:hypothetical protein